MPDGESALDYPSAQRLLSALGESLADSGLPPVPGYALHALLGEGAAGQVFLATRDGSERRLAIKVYRASGSAEDRQRALRELEAYSRLRLECLPRVIESGELEGGRLYLAMEHVDARRLDAVCDGMARREVVELLARVADAVQSMHELGVIHRDLKPSNILIDGDGRPVIVDLGLAALLESSGDWTLTREGAPIGTPAFMSPEQARAERDRVGTRSDVYALGATAYLVLTGHTPHGGDGSLTDALRRAAESEARDPRALDPMLPRALAAVLLKAVSREPSRRYASCAELAADLRRWLDGEPVQASPLGAWRRLGRWVSRHPVWTTAGVCVSMVAVVAITLWLTAWYLAWRPDHIVFSEDRRVARLVSAGGHEIARWETRGTPLTPVIAELVENTTHTGLPGRLVVASMWDPISPRGAPVNQLGVWTATSPPRLLWATTPEYPFVSAAAGGHLPEEVRRGLTPPATGRTAVESFTVASFSVRDIFEGPAYPGDEILAVHTHGQWSQRLLRIYALDGELLYEAWHDGEIVAEDRLTLWLPEEGLLVFFGRYRKHDWAELGRPDLDRDRAPLVVWAIRPRPGARAGWLHDLPAEDADAPVWYRCVLPPEVSTHFRPGALAGLSQMRPGVLRAGLDDLSAVNSFSFSFDTQGKVVGGWSPTDGFIAPEGFDPASVTLGELPGYRAEGGGG